MRFIPTWLHGALDYPLALVLIALPWLGGFADGGPEMWIPIIAGVLMLVVSTLTAYEAGILRVIPMSAHLIADGVVGVVLATSPWLFGFAAVVGMPHLILGLGEFAAALTTHTEPSRRLTHSRV